MYMLVIKILYLLGKIDYFIAEIICYFLKLQTFCIYSVSNLFTLK
jgi:hypothetical protein